MVVTPGTAGLPSTRLAPLVVVAGLLGFAGCVPEDAGYEVDPIRGGTPLPQNKATAPPASVPSGNNLPDLPSPSATVSPAAIASGSAQSLEPSSDKSYNLRIPGNVTPISTDTNWQKQPTAATNQPQPPDPLLGSATPATIPVKLQVATTTTTNTLPPIPSAGPARIDTYQQAQEQLAARGVVSQELRQIGENGVWEFRCSVPDPRNPSLRTVHEVRAPGENGVAAMRLVIQKIDAEHQP